MVPECQITKTVNKEKDKHKHRSQEKNQILKQTDVYGSLLEGKRHQSLAKPDEIKFLNEPKRTELAKQNIVSTRYTQRMCDL